MDSSTQIERGIHSLSRVATIEERGKFRGGEIVFYHLLENVPEDADRTALEGMGLDVSYYRQNGRSYVILQEQRYATPRRLSRTHVILFLATVLTTLAAGALLEGHDVFQQPATILLGWPFSLTLMGILGIHEFGHYTYARRHQIEVSPPYFIPLPPPLTFIGTLGAFIKMKGPIPNRLALLEIGAAGPIAGFIVAVPALFIGLHLSSVVELDNAGFFLGESLLMKWATTVMFPGLGPEQDVLLHPVGFAGWIGLLITMLNLLPIAQLDGGHISYALFGQRQEWVGRIVFLALIPMGLFLSPNWLFWGLLILLLMRTVRHPPVQDITRPLTPHEVRIGILCLAIFILCFIPVPFRMVG
ncbi:MAG: site-2 protease family protein [Fidelibacterota bacterium]|nr:MAG: site-2 protease family protein [Candidatus Neomarinimicrobiota bacterium]